MEIFAWILVITLGAIIATVAMTIGYLFVFNVPALHQPVFVPSSDTGLSAMLSLIKVSDSARMIDLGSGDGKVVIALAKKFPQAEIIGVETNSRLVKRSRKAISNAGLSDRVSIIKESFWDCNLGDFDVVVLYGTSYIMEKMERKAIKEMKKNSQFISNHFFFPNLKPSKAKDDVTAYQF